jgi:hypothetical protein
VRTSKPDGSTQSVALRVGERFVDFAAIPHCSRPVESRPHSVEDARLPGSGNRQPPRLAPDGTVWCLTCNTVLATRTKTFCDACQREYDARRNRERRANRQGADPEVTILESDAHAIHDATEYVSDIAWTLRVALDANVPPRQKQADIERHADELVVALKDLVWYVTARLPDNRPPDERNTEWRRRLPMPRPEPGPEGVG